MALYARYVLPRLIDLVMRAPEVERERRGVLPRAAGVVLEIGVGSGLNLALYGPAVRSVYGLDPSPPLLRRARARAGGLPFPVRLVQGSAEALPFEAAIADTVVSTWTLCSVADPRRALAEARRVLRPEGRLVFVEHGRAPDAAVARWQERLTPFWRRVAGGCHLNRAIDRLLAEAGFETAGLDAGYGTGPRVGAYLYRGAARRSG